MLVLPHTRRRSALDIVFRPVTTIEVGTRIITLPVNWFLNEGAPEPKLASMPIVFRKTTT